MSVFYFKNINPKQGVYLTGMGIYANFDNIDDRVGVLVTTREDVAKDLRLAGKAGRSGVLEIDSAEYEALKKKQNRFQRSKPKWREEFKPVKKLKDTTSPLAPQSVKDQRQSARSPAAAVIERGRTSLEQSLLPDSLKPSATKPE